MPTLPNVAGDAFSHWKRFPSRPDRPIAPLEPFWDVRQFSVIADTSPLLTLAVRAISATETVSGVDTLMPVSGQKVDSTFKLARRSLIKGPPPWRRINEWEEEREAISFEKAEDNSGVVMAFPPYFMMVMGFASRRWRWRWLFCGRIFVMNAEILVVVKTDRRIICRNCIRSCREDDEMEEFIFRVRIDVRGISACGQMRQKLVFPTRTQSRSFEF